MSDRSHEHVNSIFVHPPTPERIATPPKEEPKFHFKPAPTPDNTQSQTASTDSSSSKSSNDSPASTPKSVRIGKPKALLVTQVLPEVRSPPKRTMVMAADSLQINQKRGRRPRLFGFTELPESSGSSAEGSRHTLARTDTLTTSVPRFVPFLRLVVVHHHGSRHLLPHKLHSPAPTRPREIRDVVTDGLNPRTGTSTSTTAAR